MVGPLLDIKIRLPQRRRRCVARPRLRDRLSRGAEVALTLVSAPPGFGKTTLLTDWLSVPTADGRTVAWLSLDSRDDDPARFWAYLVASLRTAAPDVGAGALSIVQSPQPRTEAALSSLLNDLNMLKNDVVLVIDDYHVINRREVHDGMVFLLEHLPQRMHVVIAARADPPLPLALLRGRGELVEIRAADLRFTPDEASAYLNEVMGLALTEQDVAALEHRTEGWIAALQLAALSMHGRADITAFIAEFAGDDRYIVDYLAEEVLNRLPEDLKRFLMRTSILDRLSGPLCDAVTGLDGSKATLAVLERANLFLIPLDDRRRWYRYHQLFADVLQSHLLEVQPDEVAELHRRASGWFEQAGEPAEAIRHALNAQDFHRAANLAELAIPAMGRTRQESTVLGWLTVLPVDVVRVRPVLIVGFVGALLLAGRVDGVEAQLRDAERLWNEAKLARTGSPAGWTDAVVVDDAQFRGLPGMIELYRAALALIGGDVPGTVEHAERARGLSAVDDPLCRAAASGLSGLAFWSSGDLEAGHCEYARCMDGLYRAGYIADTFGCAVALADIRLAQGRLGAAMRTYGQALKRGSEQGGPVLRGTADMYVGMSEVARERNDLPSAAAYLLRSTQLGQDSGLPQNPYRQRVAEARVRQSRADLSGALDLLDDAEQVYNGDLFPNVRPIHALRARVWVLQGEVDKALGWAAERGLSPDQDLSYLREFEHITLARLLLVQGRTNRSEPTINTATHFLGRLLGAAQAATRTGSVIEILALQALADHLRGDLPAAFGSLQRALTLAEHESFVRIFADEGPPMAALLRAAAKHKLSPAYVSRLLHATEATEATEPWPPGAPGLAVWLSERELDVLRLLGTDLGGPDIARRLFVSINTVRTHTKSIYAKLGVNNRRSAVSRAQELKLL